jgi:hypothetical protein
MRMTASVGLHLYKASQAVPICATVMVRGTNWHPKLSYTS